MRLAGLHIDAFGVFSDLEISGLSPGLNVFLGENESGKTTLLAFLRAVFFGFPPGQRKENIYPPLAGGRHGGRLTLVGEDGEYYMVSRHQGPRRGAVAVVFPDGSRGDEEVLRQLTGAATEDLFRSVFAFSLSELQRFESLDNSAVRAAIYSAGAGFGRVSLAQLDKSLDDSRRQLFKTGGQRPGVNKLLGELENVTTSLHQKRAEIESYNALQDELRRLEALVAKKSARLDTRRRRLERLELLGRAWEDWVGLCRVQEELAQIPGIDSFPEDGIGRLEALQEKHRLLAGQMSELGRKIQQSEKELGGLEVKRHWLTAAEEIRVLDRGLERFVVSRRELKELQLRIERDRQGLEEELHELGPAWSLQTLEGFDASISTRDKIHHLQQSMNQARDARKQSERNLAHINKALELAASRSREAEAALEQTAAPRDRDSDSLARRREQLRTLRRLLLSREETRRSLQHLSRRRHDLRRYEGHLREQLEAVEKAPLWWPLTVLFLILGAGAFAIGWHWSPASGFAAAGAGFTVLAALLWLLRRKGRRRAQQLELLESHLRETEAELDGIRLEEERFLEEIGALEEELQRLSASAWRLEDVDRAEAEIEADLHRLHRWELARRRHQECGAEKRRLEREQEDAEKALEHERHREQEVLESWRQWLAQVDLPADLSSQAAIEVMERIRSLRQQAGSLAELEERARLLQEAVAAYESQVEAVWNRVAPEQPAPADRAAGVAYLVTELESCEQKERRAMQIQQQLEEYRSQLGELSAGVEEVDGKVQELLEEGGASEEGLFRRRAQLFQRRLRLKEDREQHLRSLENLGGREQDQRRFQEELRSSSPERLAGERDKIGREVACLEEELATAQQRRGALQERLEHLESAEEMASLRLQQNTLLAELSAAARSWAVLTLCRHFLHQAREVYERERKQPVLRESEQFFRAITGGRYQSITAPHGEERLQVIAADGVRRDLNTLSRGTAEQLYLSLRFGYIREFSRRARALPVVMDDILVNFDPRRALAAVHAMQELALRNQVLFFTCHPETASLIQEVDPRVPIRQLEAGQWR